jgi:ABC-type cobalamin/Fe3+-siderophores transport system ATPase subunit
MPNSPTELSQLIDDILRGSARFVPIAFHIHSPDSPDWGQRSHADANRNHRDRFSQDNGTKEFLDELAGGYRIVCVTDHMKSSFACELARASTDRHDISVFPGMEVNCVVAPATERIHLLVIFPQETDCNAIDRIFRSNAGFPTEPRRRGQEEFHISGSLADWAKEIEAQGGMLVIAHIDDAQRGHRARFRAMRDESLRMFATDARGGTVDDQRQVSQEYQSLLCDSGAAAIEIMNPEDRHHYIALKDRRGETVRIPCVIRSDCHCVEDFSDDRKKTFVKVSNASFAAVRDALRFFETRIKFKDDLSPAPAPRIIGLRLRSPTGAGLFKEATIAFNENLNCIIGPRGCGKSTIVEALRYVLGCNKALAEIPKEDKEDVNYRDLALRIQQFNLSDTVIEVLYQTSAADRQYLTATYDPHTSCATEVYSLSGEQKAVSANAISTAFPVSIYSWSEIENLGRQPDLQRILLDRLIERLPEYVTQRDKVYDQLEENQRAVSHQLSKLESKLNEERGVLRRYVEFKTEFDLINTPGVASLFAELDLAREKLSVLSAARDGVTGLRPMLEDLESFSAAEFATELLHDRPVAIRSWWETEISSRVRLVEIGDALGALATQVTTRIDEKVGTLDSLIAAEEQTVSDKEAALRQQTQASAEDTLVRAKREQSKKRFEAAAAKREQYQRLFEELGELLKTRADLTKRVDEVQDVISGARATSRDAMMKRINEFQTAELHVTIAFESGKDRREPIEFMRDAGFLTGPLFGQFRRSQFAERCGSMARPTQIARAILQKEVSLLASEGVALDSNGALSTQEGEQLVNNFHPFSHDLAADVEVCEEGKLLQVLSLEEKRWDDDLRILLNDRPVDKLSPGQRSSAMLPIIALAEAVPLVIDQPEDNLDNRMVGSVLTRILAELKEHRQIIVATHNPNIVVGGDAEQVIVLDAPEARRGEVVRMGSIDASPIIESVISIIEGGAEAFRTRERRYKPLL